jgi:diguanylate cyclase (GGDEF)-like protein
MADVDHFKRYNDRYGHTSGDKCLRQVAQALRMSVGRAGDVVARWGGEEFAILMPDTELGNACVVAQKMQEAVASLRIIHSDSSTGHVSVSLGVAAMIPKLDSSPFELVNAADAMLYKAKGEGRNRCAW